MKRLLITVLLATASWPSFANVNVMNFGADPTGGKLSNIAFNAALATGQCVYVPGGTYLLGPLALPTHACITGDGMTSILRLADNSNADFISLKTNTAEWVTLENLQINGHSSLQTRGACINFANTLDRSAQQQASSISSQDPRHNLKNLFLMSCKGDGIDLTGGGGGGEVSGVRIWTVGGRGVYLTAPDYQFAQVDVGATGAAGFFIAAGSAQMSNIKAWYTGYSNSAYRGAEGMGYFITNGNADLSMSSVEAQDTGQEGFVLQNSEGAIITGTVYDAGQGARGVYSSVRIDGVNYNDVRVVIGHGDGLDGYAAYAATLPNGATGNRVTISAKLARFSSGKFIDPASNTSTNYISIDQWH